MGLAGSKVYIQSGFKLHRDRKETLAPKWVAVLLCVYPRCLRKYLSWYPSGMGHIGLGTHLAWDTSGLGHIWHGTHLAWNTSGPVFYLTS